MSAEEGNAKGLSLEGLAQRLETLELENSELRSKVATLEGSQMPPGDDEDPAPALDLDGRVSRRRLLSKAGVAAAGLVVAGALTQRDIREAKAAPTVFTTDTAFRGAVEAKNTNADGWGVYGYSPYIGVNGVGHGFSTGIGVDGEGNRYGVRGFSSSGTGVYGFSGPDKVAATGTQHIPQTNDFCGY